MIDEHTIDLINGDLDGLLSPAQKEELESALAASEDVRREHEKLTQLGACLAALPRPDSPASLTSSIMAALPLSPASNVYPIGSRRLASPASIGRYGMAAAAGVLLTVFLYETTGLSTAGLSTSDADMDAMRGTAAPITTSASNAGAPTSISATSIEGPGLSGEALLEMRDGSLVLSLRLRDAEGLELSVALADTAWRIEGFSQTDNPVDFLQFNDSLIQLANVGQGDIKLVLSRRGGQETGDSNIVTLRFARDGAPLSTHTLTAGYSG